MKAGIRKKTNKSITHSVTRLFSTTLLVTALAACGSSSSSSPDDDDSTVDTEAPVITLNGDETVSLEVGSSYTDASATANDNIDGDVTVSATDTVDTNSVGSYEVTYTATDAAGNVATKTRTVIVTDTTLPVITLNGNATVTVIVGGSFSDPGATAIDNVDGAVAIAKTGTIDTNTVGSYTLTYTATDTAGNVATKTRTINVIISTADTTPPVITLNGDATVTVAVGESFSDLGATAIDAVDGDITPAVDNNVNTAITGSYTVIYTATDAAGNTANKTRTVHVIDATPPVIKLTGNAEITVDFGSTFIDPGATATDNVDGTVAVSTSGTVDTNTIGSYTLSYSATDAAGNNATTVTRTVIVADPTAPVITLNGDAEITVDLGSTFIDLGATATDNVDGTVTVTTSGTVDTNATGSYVLSYSATDAAGNSAAVVTRTVTVADLTAPVIALNGDAEITVGLDTVFTDPGATANDAVDGDITPVAVSNVDTAIAGEYTVIYTATDTAGNETTATLTVTVADLTAPVITLLGDAIMEVDQGDAFTDPGAEATDNVDGDITPVADSDVDTTTVGIYTVTYTATDAAGNEATETRTVNVNVPDNTAPVITLLGESTLSLFIGDDFSDPGAEATDDIDGTVAVVTTGDTVDTNTAGTYVLIYTATDAAGNEASITRTVNVSQVSLLNDTGITVAGWIVPGSGLDPDEAGNNSDCDPLSVHTNPSETLEAQDCSHGRDAEAAAATLVKTGDGDAGFDFTKLDDDGDDLAVSASDWSCVKDNHTNFIWEVKQSSGLHKSSNKYTWYNTDVNSNGGDIGSENNTSLCEGYDNGDSASYCNTEAFVARVNAAGLCGANNWRLPTREELRSVVHYGKDSKPRIDTEYFPNTDAFYWSSSPSAAAPPYQSWGIGFNGGSNDRFLRSQPYKVRLVRDAE